jgi:hypothetical protein
VVLDSEMPVSKKCWPTQAAQAAAAGMPTFLAYSVHTCDTPGLWCCYHTGHWCICSPVESATLHTPMQSCTKHLWNLLWAGSKSRSTLERVVCTKLIFQIGSV